MLLKSEPYKIIKPYKGKSKFDFWTDLKEGDTIQLSLLMKSEVKYGRSYVPSVQITNLTTGLDFSDTYNSIQNYLRKTEFVKSKTNE